MPRACRCPAWVALIALCGAFGSPLAAAGNPTPEGAEVVFHNCPARADVYLDGTWIGTVSERQTFSVSALPDGRHIFTFKLSGNTVAQTDLTCQSGRSLTVELPAPSEPAPPGRPAVDAAPNAPALRPAAAAGRRQTLEDHPAAPPGPVAAATTAAADPRGKDAAAIPAADIAAPAPEAAPQPAPAPVEPVATLPSDKTYVWLLALSILIALGLGVALLALGRRRQGTGEWTGSRAERPPKPVADDAGPMNLEPEPAPSAAPAFLNDLRWRETMSAKGFRVMRGKFTTDPVIDIEEVKHEGP